MSRRSSRELQQEIDSLASQMESLSLQLRDARLTERAPAPAAPNPQAEYKALLRKMIGRKVLITVKGKHQGKHGTIVRHAGTTLKPTNWYVLLPDGTETMKHKHSFTLLPREEELHSDDATAPTAASTRTP
jgi:hypothetical protein